MSSHVNEPPSPMNLLVLDAVEALHDTTVPSPTVHPLHSQFLSPIKNQSHSSGEGEKAKVCDNIVPTHKVMSQALNFNDSVDFIVPNDEERRNWF